MSGPKVAARSAGASGLARAAPSRACGSAPPLQVEMSSEKATGMILHRFDCGLLPRLQYGNTLAQLPSHGVAAVAIFT